MRTKRTNIAFAAILALATNLPAQIWNSGSSGALGNVVITSNTVWNMPSNGQFHVNTLIVNTNVTLSFNKPADGLNPPVYILARSNVTVSGTISVDGQDGGSGLSISEGGPGGFAGGGAGIPPATTAGHGQGPGRGRPLVGGAYGTLGFDGAAVPIYGNLLVFPIVGGSGGGGSDGSPGASGGGGGGALLIASDTQIALYGNLAARGGASWATASGAGSGGAVRLVAPTVTGSGRILVGSGANAAAGGFYAAYAGQGRARIDCLPQPVTISVLGSYSVAAPWRIGRNPAIFPPAGQLLEVIDIGGTNIPPAAAAFVTFPVGSSSNQVVRLRASNFTGSFDVRVDAVPENGPASRTNFVWNVGASSLATNSVTVRIPANNPTRITAWAELLF